MLPNLRNGYKFSLVLKLTPPVFAHQEMAPTLIGPKGRERISKLNEGNPNVGEGGFLPAIFLNWGKLSRI